MLDRRFVRVGVRYSGHSDQKSRAKILDLPVQAVKSQTIKATAYFSTQTRVMQNRMHIPLIVGLFLAASVWAQEEPTVTPSLQKEILTPLSRSEADAIAQGEMDLALQREQQRLHSINSTPANRATTIAGTNGRTIMRRTASKPWTGKPRVESAISNTTLTDEQLQALRNARMRFRSLFLSATVFDGKISELVWRANGESFTAISNVDFNYLRPMGSFKEGEIEWSAFFFVDNVETEKEIRWARIAAEKGYEYVPRPAPDHTLLASDKPEYVIYAENEKDVPPEMIEALDALHAHYAANEVELKIAWQRQKTLNEARDAWMKANPPQPRDTVINFWPVRSRFHSKK